MQAVKILIFSLAAVAVWAAAVGMVPPGPDGEPGNTGRLIATILVVTMFVWLGRRFFRAGGQGRASRVEEAAEERAPKADETAADSDKT